MATCTKRTEIVEGETTPDIIQRQKGGFECEFIAQPPEALQTDCPICLLVLRQPHQVTCCGYSYCKSCIERVQLQEKPCPTCNKENFLVFLNKGLKRSLYAFQIRCCHEKQGCRWTGEFGELEYHINENPKPSEQIVGCEFTEVECQYCSKLFQRHCISTHQTEYCNHRPFSCDYCDDYESGYEDVVTKHWPVCKFRPVPCPNKCGIYPELQNLKHHVNKDCPLTVVNCHFHYANCEMRFPRKDMPFHLAENLVAHMSLMAAHNQKEMQGLKRELALLQSENETLKMSLLEKSRKIAQLEQKTGPSFPVEFKMHNFSQYKQGNEIWHSIPFYTHPSGYKVCLKVVPNSDTDIFVGVCLMRGEFDCFLQWPFQGAVTVCLCSQLENTQHYMITSHFSANAAVAGRVIYREIAEKGVGNTVTYTELIKENRQLLKDDCLHFQVTKVANVDRTAQLERQCLAIESLACLPPIEFTMENFEEKKAHNEIWFSPSLYTHTEGYRFCLRVDANGHSDGWGTHTSVFIHIMRGQFDNHLRWPFRGSITIQLLNQQNDKGHCTETLQIIDASRVMCGETASRGHGWEQFIAHTELYSRTGQYLKYDRLCFRITKVKLNK